MPKLCAQQGYVGQRNLRYGTGMSLRPFHLAFPVANLVEARAFWGVTMGCPEGRSSDSWIDFNFYGHQIVAHCVGEAGGADAGTNPVDATVCRCRTSGSCLHWPIGKRWPTG